MRNTNRNATRQRAIYLAIALGTLLADQLTKMLVVSRFTEDTSIGIIPGLFQLVRVENRGIAFGLFSQSSWSWTSVILVLFSMGAIVLVGVVLWEMNIVPPGGDLGLALILGGAAGNLIDRLIRGRVVDFLDFYVGSYHWPAFNVADSAICVGVGAVLWTFLTGHHEAQRAA